MHFSQITGTGGPVGSSNIQEHLLPFDLSIFKSLHQIQVKRALFVEYLLEIVLMYSKGFVFFWTDWHLGSCSGSDSSIQKVMLRDTSLKEIVRLP